MAKWLGFLLLCFNAYALDPFSLAMVAKTASETVSAMGEVTGTLDAFTELYSEVNTDAQISQEGQKLIDEIREVEALAIEAEMTSEEIQDVTNTDQSEFERLETTIRAVTRAVRAGKRAYRLLQSLEKKAQSAQVESTQVEKEQLASMYKLIRLQQEANLAQSKRDLKELINKRNQIKALKEELKKRGAKNYQKTGILAFPKSERVIETAIETANKLRSPLLSLMLLAFMVRLVFYLIGFKGISTMGDLARDVIVCSCLMMVYPELVRAIVGYTLTLSSSIQGSKLTEINSSDALSVSMEGVSTGTKLFIAWIIEWLKFSAYSFIEFIMTFGIAFMVMLFPIVIFASQMLNFAVAWPVFLGAFITLCLWPLFWNLVGLASQISWTTNTQSVTGALYSVFFTVLQFLSPLIGMKLISGQGLFASISGSKAQMMAPYNHAKELKQEVARVAIKMKTGIDTKKKAAKRGVANVKNFTKTSKV